MAILNLSCYKSLRCGPLRFVYWPHAPGRLIHKLGVFWRHRWLV